MNPVPTKDEAYQLAVMMTSGMPAHVAFAYFLGPEDTDPFAIQKYQDAWLKSANLGKAIVQLQGGEWQAMDADYRLKYALDKHYAEMAYYLYSHNYSELTGADKTKADTCRAVLEAKVAGLAGKLDPLTRFYEEFLATARKKPAVLALPSA